MVPRNPLGLGTGDLVLLAIAALLALIGLAWRSRLELYARRLAERAGWAMLFFFLLPIVLRLALLPSHPAPTPEVYDEFGHLLMADTLRHFRLANPPHALPQFFETFFVLQADVQLDLSRRTGPRAGHRMDAFRHAVGGRAAGHGRVLRAVLLDAARVDSARMGLRRRPRGGDSIRAAVPVDQ